MKTTWTTFDETDEAETGDVWSEGKWSGL